MASKIDYAGIVWLRCPGCAELFYVDTAFFNPEYQGINVICPFCRLEFAKEEAPQMWKPPGMAC